MNNISRNRLKKLKPFFDRQRLDAILLTSAANIFYLTGFLFGDPNTQEAVAIVNKNKSPVIFMPAMFQDQAKKVFSNIKVKICNQKNRLFPTLVKHLKDKRIGFEPYNLTVGQYNRLRQKKISLISLSKKFTNLRQQKEKQELEKIKKAVEITDKTFEMVIKNIKPGKTEREIAALVKQSMENLGADREAFPAIVASGKNSAIPHHQPTNKKIKSKEIVLVDMGAKKDGYNSDMTRTIFIGKPSTEFIKKYKIVKKAQENAIKNAKPKMKGDEIDQLVREIFKKEGVEKHFLHTTGHGIGVLPHEAPSLAPKSKDKVSIDSVVTIEPGLYWPGWGGIRIEDLTVMTKSGLEIISKAPYFTFPNTASL